MGQTQLTGREGRTIVAISTPPGTGGIAVVRMSGNEALSILAKTWRGHNPVNFKDHTAHLGWITDCENEDLDQVVATVFKANHSYTGEDVVELSCHGSPWIQQAIVNRLVECGASPAGAGEFTRRAFANGRLDLAQAEGVADLIAASSKASARIAASQLKGNFSKALSELRNQLIDIGSLLELELDFSEEDVEFADRTKLIELAKKTVGVVKRLADSYRSGNAFKNGIPVAIAGVPNSGKSTLLNALIGEEKAIVSDIPGTTRDVIEDTLEIDGILFRFFDTAGLRKSDDPVESIGIERARNKINEAYIVLKLIDPTQSVETQKETISKEAEAPEARFITLLTKSDLSPAATLSSQEIETVFNSEKGDDTDDSVTLKISSKTGEGIEELKEALKKAATSEFDPQQELIVTNARHYEALRDALTPLTRLIEGLENGITSDFLAQDLREASHHLGSITGEVTSTDLLHTIFARYCIGK